MFGASQGSFQNKDKKIRGEILCYGQKKSFKSCLDKKKNKFSHRSNTQQARAPQDEVQQKAQKEK